MQRRSLWLAVSQPFGLSETTRLVPCRPGYSPARKYRKDLRERRMYLGMKPKIVEGCDDEVGTWVCDRTESLWYEGKGTTLGFSINNELVGGVIYFNYNGASIEIGAALSERCHLDPLMLWAVFAYPFDDLRCQRITAVCDSDNSRSWQFLERLGFVREATLIDAAPDGDQFVYRMLRGECRWRRIQIRAAVAPRITRQLSAA